jgi:hypothetical protein
MSSKFSTTSSSLFNNNNPEKLPDWMENLNIEIKETEVHDLGITPRGIFAEKQTVFREEKDGTPRQIEAKFNETKVITDAKIHLAKFLSGKYYKAEPKVLSNQVCVNVNVDGVPASFKFVYAINGGKIEQASTFFIQADSEEAEYPFSKAGFDECLADIRSKKIKTSRRVEAIGKPSIITKEEIVRRYNGKLREATDKINELVKNGDLIGVGSNSFASIYDVEYLFPVMEKEAQMEAPLPAFEFAPNMEHVAANPHKSANVLTIEASKTLSQFFHDFNIESSARDGNELLVKASVLSNTGVRKVCDFCFGIENEKIASLKIAELNDERMTLEQLLAKMSYDTNTLNRYLQNTAATKRIYRGAVLTAKEIHRKLAKLVDRSSIDDIVENWVERSLITPVNSTTYTTESSFEELLASVDTRLLTASEIAEIQAYQKSFGAGLDFDRQDVKDTGTRQYDEIEASADAKLASLNNALSKYFKNFTVSNFDGETADLLFVNPTTGTRNKISLKADFINISVRNLTATIGDKTTSIDKIAGLFEKSPVLAAYLQDKVGVKVAGPVVLSERVVRETLSQYVASHEIDNVINDWYSRELIASIGNGLYTSEHSFEELLNNTSVQLMSESDRKELAIARKHFGEGQKFEREDVQDSDTRQPGDYVTDDTLLCKANEFLAQHFNKFQPVNFKVENEMVNYSVGLFDEASGLKTSVNFNFGFNGNKVASCHAVINGEKVGLENVKKAFAMNEALNKYLQVNTGKRIDAPMIMTDEKLKNKLAMVVELENIDNVISQWEKTGKIERIGSNVFASKHTVEQLLSMSNLKALSENDMRTRFAKASRAQEAFKEFHIQDCDSRAIEAQEKVLSPQMITVKEKIQKVVKTALDKKVITANKFNQLELVLNEAKTENDLELAWKELKKYL